MKLLHDLLATNHVDALAELRRVGAEVASVDAVDAVVCGLVGYGDAVDAVDDFLERVVENIIVVATANVERDGTLRALDVGDRNTEVVGAVRVLVVGYRQGHEVGIRLRTPVHHVQLQEHQ